MSGELPNTPFQIFIHRIVMDWHDVFEIPTERDECGDLEFDMPDFAIFKHRLKTGVIQYDEEKDDLLYIHPNTHDDIIIDDEKVFIEAVYRTVMAGGLGFEVRVVKKMVPSKVHKENLRKWLNDQAQVAWMRENDPDGYRRTYH